MLPGFDGFGNLPPGEYTATWQDIVDRFGGNATRQAILARMRKWLIHMKQAGCRQVHINGSFICLKEAPNDYDACWDCTGVTPGLLDPDLLNPTAEGRAAIRQRFGGDIRPDMVCPPGSIRPYLAFFQKDRDGNRKGIVRIDLTRFQP